MKYLPYSIFFLLLLPLIALSQKKILDEQAYFKWYQIRNQVISNDGKWIAYERVPQKGNKILTIVTSDGTNEKLFTRASNPEFFSNSGYIAFKVSPSYDTIRKLKIKKAKKEKFPPDTLYIFDLKRFTLEKFPDLKKFAIPQETKQSWVVILQQDKKKNKKITIFNAKTGKKYEYNDAADFALSRNGKQIAFITKNDSLKKSGVFVFNTQTKKVDSLAGYADVKKISVANYKNFIAWIASADTVKTKVYSLYFYDNEVKKIVDTLGPFKKGFTVSPYGNLWFSRDDRKLFFGIAPKPKPQPRDTIPDDEKISVDVWAWTDSVIQPMQKVDLKEDKEFSYLAVYNLEANAFVQIQNSKFSSVKIPNKGNSDFALVRNTEKYVRQMSWDYPFFGDYYVVNLFSGDRKHIISKSDNAFMSPNGKFVVWYNIADSNWYFYDVKNSYSRNLTAKVKDIFYDVENDIPSPAFPYGEPIFSTNDSIVLIYSQYDIWRFDLPSANAENITAGYGKRNHIVFRYIFLDDDDNYLNPKAVLIAKGFNKINKNSGYYRFYLHNTEPRKLLESPYDYMYPIKAKNANILLWRRRNVSECPDLWTSDLNFKKITKISDVNPVQKQYIWANVKLVKWKLPNGKTEEGLLYYPENLDTTKKYPMIVYYYERYSDRKNYYYVPAPSRSVINPVFYASNGYIIFIPNIRYKIGHPGKSAVEYVVSGTKAMYRRFGWIDSTKLGLQGQSWGGYETAYIITQTSMFAAAEAGAPVANMTSAYGGIRWQSGMSREFQYERTQSRIGVTLWDNRDLYIENSPLFYADKVTTPLLIMHNDNDGAVPWYQGIEYFMALRRLNKPVWLLCYNNEPHNLRANSPNRYDLSKRMMQFFDHYLKGKPMPYWMKYGIPQIQKGKNLGYRLIDD